MLPVVSGWAGHSVCVLSIAVTLADHGCLRSRMRKRADSVSLVYLSGSTC